ncbi:hypothetical protein CC85DRAFT_316537 [Cutaneotrichosporon oleaginosum]|uniref:Phospholipid/glycerol acyltransferase domain-containing protein n=1 Tax=Cutaneotrichosporon oleaginosum TaxID=879819 RepID=A0A0J0XRP8_9TREE|nr:uncharacterized protein CC85DRAFT_316537 [Cutaneotrichosporon oleaginosum]KLT43760.1 hypothetical protein CC85DRAFT_316537 [Cutaneotrichosporon oleaginosum]TXT05177.1 hypothetical protein COLE_06497 [Cutaneotrichosporon oleaginosum]
MEKFSRWRPFLPLASPSSPLRIVLSPLSLIIGLARAVLLAVLLVIYLTLGTLAAPIRPLSNVVTYICARTALFILGWYWIDTELTSAKKKKGTAYTPPPPRRGDLILANWTSWVDVLVLAYLHNPVFLLPVFTGPAPLPEPSFGRATGTGSANILAPAGPPPPCAGYVAVSPLALMARAGTLPPLVDEVDPARVYPTLAAARRAIAAPTVLLPEGTTSNGRAVLRFGEGVLAEDVSQGGVVWIKFVRHAPPSALLPGAACSLPRAGAHFRSVLFTPPVPRAAAVRTLHPSNAPSAPTFMPSEVLASQPGGLGAAKAGAEWRDACAIVLAETGRVRRVPGMGWVEKASFLDYYARSRR